MKITEIDLNTIDQALANIRLEGLNMSDELTDILENLAFEDKLTTTDILKKLIED